MVENRGRDRRGIIPACAGNTPEAIAEDILNRDHPRVCGEHYVIPDGQTTTRGSSPRVRGTHHGDGG